MDNMPEPDWNRELKLCNIFLEYDERNFHCWDYRRIIVQRSKVPAEKELKFTDDKICRNFSNFSSWHYRSKLLPVIHPDPDNPVGVQENILLSEFELVQNAFFTDPNDQSAWFYHRWLLGRGEKQLGIECLYVSRILQRIVAVFSKDMKIENDGEIEVKLDDSTVDVTWKPVIENCQFCQIWYCSLPELEKGKKDIVVNLGSVSHRCVSLDVDDDECWSKDEMEPGKLFSLEMSASTTSILTQELESCRQLDELEPDNKWTVLTIVSLMRALDPLKYENESCEYLGKLMIVDPYRQNYYKDIKSKFLIENAIERLSTTERNVTLTDSDLTTLHHHHYLALCQVIDLSNNQLSSLKHCQYYQCVNTLKLDDNKLTSLTGLDNLKQLRSLSVRNNLIKTIKDVEMLSSCSNLQTLNISGNPICEMNNLETALLETLPTLEILNDKNIG